MLPTLYSSGKGARQTGIVTACGVVNTTCYTTGAARYSKPMQKLREIREILAEAGLWAHRRLGQCFLIDQNLLGKLLELAALSGDQTVLEVGPGTGSLTEELLSRARRVVAVEIDGGLLKLLRRRLGQREKLVLIGGDVMAGKNEIAPGVLAALGRRADLVANLPYNVATPLLAECLLGSWRALAAPRGAASCRFDGLTFTVQREVADKLAAAPGSGSYGPVSVLTSLLGRSTLGPRVPPEAFWPRPAVASRMMRIDFDSAAASRLAQGEVLTAVLRTLFGNRRKQIGSIVKREPDAFGAGALAAGLEAAGIDPVCRAEQVPPQKFLALANALAAR